MKILLFSFLAIFSSEAELLHQGLELQRQGEFQAALATWERAFTELDEPSLAIGRAYIRLATREKRTGSYQTASNIYLWGLTQQQFTAVATDTLSLELDYTEPVMSPDRYKRARKALEENDPATAARLLLGMWNQLDPTPGTNYNERLIEHWERIAHAQQEFTENDDTIYGADERAITYVKYGAPDKQFEGSIYVNTTDVERTCSHFNGRCNPDVTMSAIQTLDPMPFYNVWVYYRNSITRGMESNLVLIFAESASTGFGRLRQVEELIPSRAFTFTDRYDQPSLMGVSVRAGSMTPGMVLQWIYYNEFAGFDNYFAKITNDMDREWTPAGPRRSEVGPYQGPMLSQQVQMETTRMLMQAPPEQSSYAASVPQVPIELRPYRFLDSQRRPYYRLFVQSLPHDAVLTGLPEALDTARQIPPQALAQHLSGYELTHGVRITDGEGTVLTRKPTKVGMEVRDQLLVASSLHTVPALPASHTLTLFTELHKPDSEMLMAKETVFEESLRGLSSRDAELPAPLAWPQEGLLMGDLVLGWDMDYERMEQTPFPFTVSHDRTIPRGEALALHLELYNLATGAGGQSDFELTYRVTKSRALQWLRGRQAEVSLTVSFQSPGPLFAENLEIQTRELSPGDYYLELEIRDKVSGEKLEKAFGIKVEE